MSVMAVSPGDVVSTAVGVLHVGSVIVERSREGVSFAVSGVAGDGVVHSNVSVAADVVPLAVDASDAEALVWFDRERYLKRLSESVFCPGDGFAALGRCMSEWVDLSLSDREPVDAVLERLVKVDAGLVWDYQWVVRKRAECLEAFEDFHAGWLKYQSKPWSEPVLGECRKIDAHKVVGGVELRVGGIYQFQRADAPVEGGCEYFKVVSSNYNPEIILYGASTRVNGCSGVIISSNGGFVSYANLRAKVGDELFWIDADTVKLLPIGSLNDIDSYLELSEYADVSLSEALQGIFLDMFSADEGKPKCLPVREELDDDRYCWDDDYAKCRGVLMGATADLLFDIEKSLGHVRWVRDQLKVFYRELGFTF